MVLKYAFFVLAFFTHAINAMNQDNEKNKIIIINFPIKISTECCSEYLSKNISFFDPKDASSYFKKVKWAKEGEGNSFYAFVQGANLEGKCKNNNCIAFNKQVASGLGYGDFILARNGEFVIYPKCKNCNDSFTPTTTGFCNCYFKLTGRKENNSSWNSGWTRVEGDPLICDESNHTDKFVGYKIECRKLSDPPEDEGF